MRKIPEPTLPDDIYRCECESCGKFIVKLVDSCPFCGSSHIKTTEDYDMWLDAWRNWFISPIYEEPKYAPVVSSSNWRYYYTFSSTASNDLGYEVVVDKDGSRYARNLRT